MATRSWPTPGVIEAIVGAPGTVRGVTLLDGADAIDGPVALVAVTVNVYAVPFARPLTVIEVQGALHVPVIPDGDEVAVNCVMGDPPLLAGALNVTVAWALPAVAAPIVGAPGTVVGVTLLDAADAVPTPTPFVAVTVNV
jgi:hypothetical protein